VSVIVSFASLDISAFDDASFRSTWEASYKSQLATFAGLSSSDVTVNSISAGRCARHNMQRMP
jgi:hypothetical protein